jgi:hypothetical protein
MAGLVTVLLTTFPRPWFLAHHLLVCVQFALLFPSIISHFCTGVGESVEVAISNGIMPLLQDSRPYFSYTVGPAPPPVVNFSNIGACHLDINWRVAYDLWDALITTGYWYDVVFLAEFSCL